MEQLLQRHNMQERFSQAGVPMVRCGCNVTMAEAVHPYHQAVQINDYVLSEERMAAHV